ncbi:MAG: hypothetical protein RLZZ373_3150 [Pseudomonadota bacterium]
MSWKNYPIAALVMLLGLHLVAHVDRNLLVAFAPQVIGDLSINNTQFGFLAGAAWVLSYSITSVLAGALADRYSRTRILGVAILIWSACTAASGYAMSFEQMVAARLLVACGEAALVPAALSLLIELFSVQRFSTASGVFFMGLPLGTGAAFLIAGTYGAVNGWRGSFYLLGVIGALLAVPMFFLRDDRGQTTAQAGGLRLFDQVRTALADLRATPVVGFTMLGFVTIHIAFASLAFIQVWLVQERGFEAAEIARRVGGMQLTFGTLGALVGGVLADRLARRVPGGHAGFIVLLMVLCGPLMLMRFVVASDSPAFFVCLCAAFFLPLAIYGPANALLQGLTPARSRSLVTGITILLINVIAIAIASAVVGAAIDKLKAAGAASPLSTVLFWADATALCSAFFFLLAARQRREASLMPMKASA